MSEASHLPIEVQPFLRDAVVVEPVGDEVRRIGNPGHGLTFAAGIEANAVGKLAACLDGRTSLQEVSRKTKLELEQVRALTRRLYVAGLVGDRTEVPIPALLFFDHLRSVSAAWAPAEAGFDVASLTLRGVIGLVLHKWFSEQARCRQLAAAITRAGTARSRGAWTKLLAHEHERQFWIEEGLRSALTVEQMRSAYPLAGWVARTNVARWASQNNELAYAAICALGEGASTPSDSRARLLMLTEKGPAFQKLIAPVLRRGVEDEQLLEVCRVPFEDSAPLTLLERDEIVGFLWDFAKAHEAEDTMVLEYYLDPATPEIHTGPNEGASSGEGFLRPS